jgi:Xaa-Pro aminopeptidase
MRIPPFASAVGELARRADRFAFGAGISPVEPDLTRFRALQQLAYRCAEETARTLHPGVTEREAAHHLGDLLQQAGVREWFHTPFAWFGDRTAFRGFRLPHQFLPTRRRLEEGMPYILDCAPVLDGACADIGYSDVIGSNPKLDYVRDALAEHRALILRGVRAGDNLAEIYRSVDRLAARQGLENRHQAYPGRVLAHRVEPLVTGPPRGRIGPFGGRHLRALAGGIVEGRRTGTSPLWAGSARSEHPPTPGLWAVEPHLALRDVGAKFEELLVVSDDGTAVWLDDVLPHVLRWKAAA